MLEQRPVSGSVRQLIDFLLRTDADLDAFCLDCFPTAYRRFGKGMERTEKVNLLLSLEEPSAVATKIQAWRVVSADFSTARGGLLQLLDVSLSPCCRYHPAQVSRRIVQNFDDPCCLRPAIVGSALGSSNFRGHLCVQSRYGPATHSPSY